MYSKIYKTALKKKVFQMWQLVEELAKKYSYIPKSIIKEKVRTFTEKASMQGIIKQVNKDPAIFAFTEFEKNWQQLIDKKTCPICGSNFIQSQSKQQFCSEKCKKEHYKQYHEQRRKKAGMKTGTKRRWKKSEELFLLKLKNEGYTYEQISKNLGRSITSVIEKYKTLTGVRK